MSNSQFDQFGQFLSGLTTLNTGRKGVMDTPQTGIRLHLGLEALNYLNEMIMLLEFNRARGQISFITRLGLISFVCGTTNLCFTSRRRRLGSILATTISISIVFVKPKNLELQQRCRCCHTDSSGPVRTPSARGDTELCSRGCRIEAQDFQRFSACPTQPYATIISL